MLKKLSLNLKFFFGSFFLSLPIFVGFEYFPKKFGRFFISAFAESNSFIQVANNQNPQIFTAQIATAR